MGPTRERPGPASFCRRHRGRLAGAAAAPLRVWWPPPSRTGSLPTCGSWTPPEDLTVGWWGRSKGTFNFGPIRGILLALALALAMRRERTWPTSPSCGEAPDAAGPPQPKTAAWPWSPSRSRWSGWRSWTNGSRRFGRATSPGWRAGAVPRPFQAGVPALPSNTPGGVDAAPFGRRVHNAPALTVTAFTLGGA
jgi:hypothetical protein